MFVLGVFAVGDDPGNYTIRPPDDKLPKRIGGGYAMTGGEMVVDRVLAPDHAAKDKQLVDIPVALRDLSCSCFV